ncbi:MAG: CRISPR-associated CARF protein Csx1 [Pyrobaculum sp.]|jgi:CRISPR-associated protein Csx1
MGGGSVLVAAAWGYPPGWRKARYRVEPPQHPAFKDARQVECTSCSSTLALIRFFRENGWDVKTLIFGVDTALNPADFADGKEFRNNVKEQYVKWFRELEKTSNCSAELEPEVVVLPNIGRYWGRRFEGAPLAMFNEALRALRDADKPTFLAVDLTHGINFQTVAVLYAAVAAAVIWGVEKNLLIFNSDPYPTGAKTEQCVSDEKAGGKVGAAERKDESIDLFINDVSELQKAVRNIRQIAALRRFQMPELEDLDRTGELGQLLAYICLLANGAAGLAFSGASYDDGGAVAQLPRVEVKPPDTTPIIAGDSIKYPEPDRTYAVKTAMASVVDDLRELRRGDLVGFLNAVADRYEKTAAIQNHLVLWRTADDFSIVIMHARELGIGGELSAAEIYAIVDIHKTHKGRVDQAEFARAVEAKLQEIEEDRGKLRKALGGKKAGGKNVYVWLRNLSAHGGLSYILIDKVRLSEGKIVEVVYRRDLLQPLLDELMRQCKLKNR